MNPEARPSLSIVMPVFNTGPLLVASVRSVIDQTLFASEPDGYWELLVVDDASDDPATLAALDAAARLSPAVRVLRNQRTKGPAGSRNTGLIEARGEWIGFLDSDDLWYPDFLQRQRDAFAGVDDASWRAAHFDVGDDEARVRAVPLKRRSPCLYRHVATDYEAGRVSVLRRPVDILLRCGCLQVMTVQVRTALIRELGGFDETLPSAEDYDLWLRLACRHDLQIAPIDAGIYRLRSGSITRSGKPMYFAEDRMLESARDDPCFASHRNAIDWRMRYVLSHYCSHYRERRSFSEAASCAFRLIGVAPLRFEGWKHLAAVALRR